MGDDELGTGAVQGLMNREEILQICFWLEGEGLGEVFDTAALERLLDCGPAAIGAGLSELRDQGHLEAASGHPGGYRLSETGRKHAGRLFADNFSDMQKAGHGECAAGCCDGDDHSQCGAECEYSQAAPAG